MVDSVSARALSDVIRTQPPYKLTSSSTQVVDIWDRFGTVRSTLPFDTSRTTPTMVSRCLPIPMELYKVAAALQDFIRCRILELLHKEPLSVAVIREKLRTEYTRPGKPSPHVPSRPSVSQHLKVLSKAGLVTPHREGVRNIYRFNAAALDELRGFLERLGS